MAGGVASKGQLRRVIELVQAALGDQLLGIYLCGSAVAGGLRPASDLDLFVITSRRTSPAKRGRLIAGLRPLSARDARPSAWRPVELTVVALPDIVPWRYPPRMDFQSGEWLRGRFDAGDAKPWRSPNPDLAVLIAQVRLTSRPMVGPSASELLPEIPPTDLLRAMTDEIQELMDDLETDTANVLLTLARIWHTLETGAFAAKNAAADWALARLAHDDRAPLEQARGGYLGLVPGSWLEQDAWQDRLLAVRSTAGRLVEQIRLVAARDYNRSR